jgi:hypothetical protein
MFALVSAGLLFGAGFRVSTAAGFPGLLGLAQMLGMPAGIAIFPLGLEVWSRARPTLFPPRVLIINKRFLVGLVCLSDLFLLGVVLFGFRYVLIMLR